MEKRFSDSIEYIMKHDPITDKRIGSKGVFFRLPHWAGVQWPECLIDVWSNECYHTLASNLPFYYRFFFFLQTGINCKCEID